MENSPHHLPSSERLLSLDTLRGFDMFWIIGGSSIITGLLKAFGCQQDGIASQFEHVRWEGLHFFDLIWPLFMFIVGVSIPLSIEKRKTSGTSKRELYFHAVQRAVIMFIIGMILQGGLLEWDLTKLHPCYSVLHGIAAGYLIAFIVAMELKPRAQLLTLACFLAAYWAVIMLVPVPGKGVVLLTPESNLATWFDQQVLGRFHHGENTWFLSYPAFASSVLLGVMAGHLIRLSTTPLRKVMYLGISGIGSIGLGLLISLSFPVIKLMWTSSFVLIGGGYGFLLFAVFYWIIDVMGFRKWTLFFRVIGMNSIAVYTAAMLISFKQIGDIFVGSLLPRIAPWDEFLSSLTAVCIIWLILYWMYRQKTFIKI
jgi:predicted acyltransferase